MFLVTFDFEHPILSGVMQVYECKSCETSNQMLFNVMFLFLKMKDTMVMT